MSKPGPKRRYAKGITKEVRIPGCLIERLELEAESLEMDVQLFLYCLVSATVASPGPSLYIADKITSVNYDTLTPHLKKEFLTKRTDRPPMGTASLAHRIVGSYIRQGRFEGPTSF